MDLPSFRFNLYFIITLEIILLRHEEETFFIMHKINKKCRSNKHVKAYFSITAFQFIILLRKELTRALQLE